MSPDLKVRVMRAIDALSYKPSQVARNLRRGRTQLIALAVADLANPVLFAHRLRGGGGRSGLGLFARHLQQRREARHRGARALERIRQIGCDGAVVVPVGSHNNYRKRDLSAAARSCCSAARSTIRTSTP